MAEPDGHRHPQQSPGLFLEFRNLALCLVNSGQNRRTALIEGATLLGQVDAPGRAVEEPGAESILKPPDKLANGRWRQFQSAHRSREVLLLNDAYENRHFALVFHDDLAVRG